MKYKYNGQVAVLEFIDPSLHRVPVAVAVFGVENLDNYTWMVSMCKANGLAGVIGKVTFTVLAVSESLLTPDSL